MKNKKIWAIAVLLAIGVGSVFVYAQDRRVILRTTQEFVGGGANLTLFHNGTFSIFQPNVRRADGRYSISGNVIILFEEDGREVMRLPFAWERQGATIAWVELAMIRLYRRQ